MSISLDITFLIQLVNFLVSLLIINALIIKPIRKNMAQRQAIIDADKKETNDFTSKIEAQQHLYDERLRAVRVEVTKQRESIKLDAEGSAQQKLQQANDKARVLRQESTQKIQGESQEAMSVLQNKISSYTQEALTKILA